METETEKINKSRFDLLNEMNTLNNANVQETNAGDIHILILISVSKYTYNRCKEIT